MRYAGLWRRLGAYLIDVVPIVLLTGAVSYAFFGFDETLSAYLAEPRDPDARARFLTERNWIRDSSFLVWLLYSTLMEASPLQGTLGKAAVGIKVIGPDAGRLTFARSVQRNISKLTAYLSLGVGFLRAAFSREKRAWHDTIAKTWVVMR